MIYTPSFKSMFSSSAASLATFLIEGVYMLDAAGNLMPNLKRKKKYSLYKSSFIHNYRLFILPSILQL